MKIQIEQVISVATQVLLRQGFDEKVANGCVKNIIEAELAGKKTHGIIRCLHLKSWVDKGKSELSSTKLKVIKKSANHLYLNGNKLPGFYVIDKSLDISLKEAKKSKIFMTGIKNVGITGYIGDYARRATEKNLIYIGFHNSQGGLVPYGAIKDTWGTNPLTFGFPSGDLPVIFDSASSKITWGELMLARKLEKKLPYDVAVDEDGNVTDDPNKAVALLPFFGRKGSGFAMVVEMLAGVLTGSGVGNSIPGGWGSFYILIDPTMFRSLKDFKKDVDTAIKELKSLHKAKGVKEIFFPGEHSGKLRQKNLKQGWIEVDDKLWKEVVELAD